MLLFGKLYYPFIFCNQEKSLILQLHFNMCIGLRFFIAINWEILLSNILILHPYAALTFNLDPEERRNVLMVWAVVYILLTFLVTARVCVFCGIFFINILVSYLSERMFSKGLASFVWPNLCLDKHAYKVHWFCIKHSASGIDCDTVHFGLCSSIFVGSWLAEVHYWLLLKHTWVSKKQLTNFFFFFGNPQLLLLKERTQH